MNEGKHQLFTVKNIATIGLLGALGGVLMSYLEIPLPFFPTFYKLDLSEVAGLLAGFLMGPVAAVLVELLKVLLYLVLHGTTSAFIGDLASFVLGCAYVVPTAIIYRRVKKRNGIYFGMIVGGLSLTVFGALMNAYFLLPWYADFYGMPLETIIEMGSAINSSVSDLFSFVALMTVPFNLVKAAILGIVMAFVGRPLVKLYKRI